MMQHLRTLWSVFRAGKAPSHKDRMERLYDLQAESYDLSREKFLLGRDDLVGLLNAPAGGRVVEMGGGTGRNLERFGERLQTFSTVFLVDLNEPLLRVARQRRERLGWRNVHVLEGDATAWQPPDGAPVDVVFFAYSLTMIPDWFRAVDNALALLRPGGLLGAADFAVPRKHPTPGRDRMGALARQFWMWWFAHHDVMLSSDHIPYLEGRTRTGHLSERRGTIPDLPLLRPPYYVFVGRKLEQDD
jgi:S-adenosylmethionine-diacylgycerolhomoserine-N-methlytransferase